MFDINQALANESMLQPHPRDRLGNALNWAVEQGIKLPEQKAST